MDWLIKLAAPMVIPLLVAPLTVVLGRLILNARLQIDSAPAYVKQSIVVAISTLLTGLASTVGGNFCPEVCTLENLDQQALVSALLSFALHNGLKKGKR